MVEQLKRQVGVPGAVLLGLGSIVGTGVYVGVGLAADLAGSAVVWAVVVGGALALCNGLSSAQLAAAHPVAGGTYAYGARFIHPLAGFVAGWLFMAAKSASAATAALAIGLALSLLPGLGGIGVVPLAILVVAVVAALVLAGVRRSNAVNAVLVGVAVSALAVFVGGVFLADQQAIEPATIPFSGRDFLEACALMFVAYTGYGRIATLGEEVVDPAKSIPRSMIVALAVIAVLYVVVGFAVQRAGGGAVVPIAKELLSGPLVTVIGIGAVVAMLGVLLNLILGLSRVALAMGRGGDLPSVFAKINAAGTSPVPATFLTAVIIGGLCLLGDVKTAWSFSAFAVLIYYGLTNAVALRLPEAFRLYPRWISVFGLLGCVFLAWWVQPVIWVAGLGTVAAGLIWRWLFRRWANARGQGV